MTGQLDTLMNSTVYDSHDDKIGKIKNIYVDNETGSPTWAGVSTGLFGHDSLVPLVGAQYNADDSALRVSVEKAAVKSAPRLDDHGQISRNDEQELFRHYHVDPSHSGWDAYGRAVRGPADGMPQQQSGYPDRDRTDRGMGDRDDTLIRSEERLNVGTEREETGTARLRKYVVTEDQTVTVPTSHEEVRIEREPITGADATARSDFGDEEREVTLHRDRVTVDKEQVPVERVRMAVDDVEEQQTVGDTVRKERIDAEGFDDDRTDRRYDDSADRRYRDQR